MPDANVLEALTLGVARLVVARERVERSAAIRDLRLAVRPPDRAERVGAGRLLTVPREQRVPRRHAARGADETAPCLGAERIQRHAGAVDQHALAKGVPGLDGLCSPRRARCAPECGDCDYGCGCDGRAAEKEVSLQFHEPRLALV